MSRRKLGKENIRKIQQSKGSYFVRIPISMMRKLNWRERQKVVVKKTKEGVRIVDWPAHQKDDRGKPTKKGK